MSVYPFTAGLRRRALYRLAKKVLKQHLAARCTISPTALERAIRALLRGKRRPYLQKLLRVPAYAAFAASALIAGLASAAPPIELSNIALSSNSGGFAMNGESPENHAGGSVSDAGDVNGDGLADVIVGANSAAAVGPDSGRSYVVFGKSDNINIDLVSVTDGAGGFAINGESSGDKSGWSVSGAGDVNGDDLSDLIVGAPGATPAGPYSGKSYVVFGKPGGTAVDLSNVAAGIGGFAITGEAEYDLSGFSVSGAGDVNGDGLDDVIVGAPYADPYGSYSGTSYVVFGKKSGAPVDLSAVAVGTGGFAIFGQDTYDLSGFNVSDAGDVNGDELGDLVVGAIYATQRYAYTGRAYVVFGKTNGTAVSLARVAAGIGGISINGESTLSLTGVAVSGAGDVNGDGFDDVVVGATYISAGGLYSGRSYVVFGKNVGGIISLSTVTAGSGGFAINGEATRDYSGVTVSGAGDVNVDGFDDVIVGAAGADPNGSFSGRTYIVFGKPGTTAINLSAVTAGAGGFVINGEAADDFSGRSVSGVGDMDGDGVNDIIVGAWGADPNGSRSGKAYVVFYPSPKLSTVYVDFAFSGTEQGTHAQPFNTLFEGVGHCSDGGMIILAPGSTTEIATISKPLTLQSAAGPVLIGIP